MDTKNRILNRGGFVAALMCLFVSACGPNGSMDSGMMTDAGMPPGDSGPDMPDSYVPPDVDGGTLPDAGTDSGTEPTCSGAEVASRTPGCGEQYDLLTDMEYTDSSMPSACTDALSGSWTTIGASGCPVTLFREAGTNHLMVTLDCPGALDMPYGGQYRLAPDGRFLGNCGNRDLPGDAGNCGILTPTASCRTLNGEFFHGGESVPYRTQVYTHE